MHELEKMSKSSIVLCYIILCYKNQLKGSHVYKQNVLSCLMLCGRGNEKYGMKMLLIECVNTVVFGRSRKELQRTCKLVISGIMESKKVSARASHTSSVIKHVEQSASEVNGVIGCNWTATQ